MKSNFYFILLFLIVLSQSCSKDENQPTTDAVEKKVSLTSTLDYVTNGHTIGNVQVGDTITYRYSIISNIPNGDFYIVPETTSAILHQLRNVDFTLFYNKLKCDTVKCLAKSGKFKILVNRPGNFQNTVTALNFEKGQNKPITFSNSIDVLFNAIKITAYVYWWDWDSSQTWGNKYYTFLHINTGNQINDTYLTGLNYNIFFDSTNQGKSNFSSNTNILIKFQNGPNPYQNPQLLTNISKINFIKPFNGINTNIEYTNIPVSNLGRRDDLQDIGNNNIQ